MNDKKLNGSYKDIYFDRKDREAVLRAAEQIDEIYAGIPDVYQTLQYLQSLPEIKDKLGEIKDKLLPPAVAGKLDKDAHILMLKILGVVIVGLVFCLVFVITGEKMGFMDYFKTDPVPRSHPYQENI